VTIEVLRADDRPLLERWLALGNAVEPEAPQLLDDLLAMRRTDPRRVDLLAFSGGEDAGIASISPTDEHELADGWIAVVPADRGRDVGAALLEAVSAEARSWSASRLQLWIGEDEVELIAALRARGFEELLRERVLAVDLDTPLPAPDPSIAVAAAADHEDGAYAVGVATWRDVPGDTGILSRDAWVERNVHEKAAALVALIDGAVAGFACLEELADPSTLAHGLTAILPAYRRRGIARALKLSLMEWACARGTRRLVTWTADGNEPMWALNAELGYVPLRGTIALRGPVAATDGP
jgi:GNAT superfamily N-acetyltransferase